MSKSLLEAVTDLNESHINPTNRECSVLTFLKSLEETEREAVLTLIDNRDVPVTRVHQLLTEFGFKLSGQQLSRHRNRGLAIGCKCPK